MSKEDGLSEWVDKELDELVDARHSQDMAEGKPKGHLSNRIKCQLEGECYFLRVRVRNSVL
jgi:hypothetical protein